MSDVRANVVVNLAGNLPRQAARYGRDYTHFANTMKRSNSVLQRSIVSVDKHMGKLSNRFTAIASGAVVAGAIKQVVDFDAELKQLAVDADITDQRLAKVKTQIMAVANNANIRVDKNEMLAAIQAITAQTGDIQVAIDNLENIGLTIRATGAQGADAGALIANFYEKFQIKNPKDMLKVLDESARLGKEGAFELRNLATEGNSVTAAYAATGRVGPTAVKEMNAILQIIRRTTPSAAEAATPFERIISTLTVDKVGELQKAGIQIWDVDKLKEGVKVARPVPQIIEDILQKSKGDVEVLGKIFDIRAMKGIQGFMLEFNENSGTLPSMQKFNAIVGDGNKLLSDAARNAVEAKAAYQALKNTVSEVANEKLSPKLKALAGDFDERGQEGAKSLVNAGVTGAGILGSGLLLRKIPGIRGLFSSLLGKAFTPKPLPGSLVTGGFRPSAATRLVRGGRFLASRAGLVGAAGAAGYGAGTLLYKYGLQGNAGGDFVGRNIAQLLSLLGSTEASNSLEREQKFEIHLQTQFDQNGNPTRVTANQHNVDFTAERLGPAMAVEG